MLKKLEQNSKEFWRGEADSRVHKHWYRQFGEERYEDVRDAVENPTPEQQQVNRKIRERYLTAQASDWFSWELDSALGGYRLIVLITNFELIEADKMWFKFVSQYFLNKLCDHNVGLVITRRVLEDLSVDRTFSAYNLDRFTQFDLAEYI